MKPRAVEVLLVEDDDVDVEAVRRAFERERIANPIHVAHDGAEALDCLRGTNGRERIRSPFLILLDINMPRMNGLEFLGELRRDPQLASSVVFVLTTSDRDEDRLASYRKNIAGYILKSRVGEGFIRLVTMMECYWRIVELPEIAR